LAAGQQDDDWSWPPYDVGAAKFSQHGKLRVMNKAGIFVADGAFEIRDCPVQVTT
jgi:hypothetical protein